MTRRTGGVLLAACAIVLPLAATGAPQPAPDRGDWLRARIAAATAAAVIDVPPGEYRGRFVVDRPLTLRGGGLATLRGDGTTHVIVIAAEDVTLDGFEIRDSGRDLERDQAAVYVTGARATVTHNRILDSLHGIYVRQADAARIEDNVIVGAGRMGPADAPEARAADGTAMCDVPLNQNRRGNGIHLWKSSGHLVARNRIRDTRDGVYFSFVSNSDVRNNEISGVRYGLHYMYSDRNRFEDNVFHDNAAGAALMFSKGLLLQRNRFAGNRGQRAYGLLLQSVDDSRIVDNQIAGNTVGLFAEGSHGNQVERNRVAGNYVGVRISDSSDANVFTRNAFTGNVHAVETSGANAANRWAVNGRGNYWDGGSRLDLDGDGIADLPHRELDLFAAVRRPFPEIGLLAGSPGERLLRFVHARIAVPGLPGITDPSPLVEDAR